MRSVRASRLKSAFVFAVTRSPASITETFPASPLLHIVQDRQLLQRQALSWIAMDRFITKTPRHGKDGPKGSPSSSTSNTSSTRLTRAGIAPAEIEAEKEKYSKMTLKEKRKLYKCGADKFLSLNTAGDIKTWPEYAASLPRPKRPKEPKYDVNKALNQKVSLLRADITALEIDAIVNAANNALLGGGGVDGAIHSAAGPMLKRECATLKGCETGDAKITLGYKLPAKHVIHTVGPIGEDAKALRSCYTRCLQLVKENNLKSVAFPCISTGIYGYPPDNAAHVALDTTRLWLETDDHAKKMERIIFCVFLKNDVKIYEDLMPVYFPLGPSTIGGRADGEEEATSKAESKKTQSSAQTKDTSSNASSQAPATPADHTESQDEEKRGGEKHRDGAEKHRDGTEKNRDGTEKHRDGTEKNNDGAEKHRDGTEKNRDGTEKHRDGTEKNAKDSGQDSGDQPPPSKRLTPTK